MLMTVLLDPVLETVMSIYVFFIIKLVFSSLSQLIYVCDYTTCAYHDVLHHVNNCKFILV